MPHRIAGAAMLVVAETGHGRATRLFRVVDASERTADRPWLVYMQGRLDKNLAVVRLTDQVRIPAGAERSRGVTSASSAGVHRDCGQCDLDGALQSHSNRLLERLTAGFDGSLSWISSLAELELTFAPRCWRSR